jgi:hypothetical protein
LKPPPIKVMFTMGSDWSEQRMAGVAITRRPHPLAEMPWGCQVYIDKHTRANCRLEFDARVYRHDGMQALVDRYVRLLEAAAERPDLPIGRLVAMTSTNPLRRALANYRVPAAERLHGSSSGPGAPG